MHSVGSVGVARGGYYESRGLEREDVSQGGTSGRRASGVLTTPEVAVNLRNEELVGVV